MCDVIAHTNACDNSACRNFVQHSHLFLGLEPQKLPNCLQTLCRIFIAFLLLTGLALAAPGQLDTSFGTGGIVRQNVATAPDSDGANAMLRQSDGKLVVAGGCNTEHYRQICLIRYTPQGARDLTFNGTGTWVSTFPDDSYAIAIVELDTRLYVLGTCASAACLLRLNGDGTSDPTFGTNGVLTMPLAGIAPSAIAVQGTKLVLAGSCFVNASNRFCVLRLSAAGVAEIDFGTNGLVMTVLGNSSSNASAVTISGSKVIVGGTCEIRNSGVPTLSVTDICITRYNGDGSLDTTFNGTGKANYSITAGNHSVAGIAMDGDRIVVGGSCNTSVISWQYPQLFCALRLTASGVLDTTFDADGGQTVQLSNQYAVVTEVGLEGSRVVLAGFCHSANGDRMCAARFNENGSLDTSLFGAGTLIANAPTDSYRYANALIIDNGKLVLGGECSGADSQDFCIARFNRDGTPDMGFNSVGLAIAPLGVKPLADFIQAVTRQNDGKVVAAGYCKVGTEDQFCIVRFNADGSLDHTFNGNGKLILVLGAISRAAVVAMAGDKIVIGGSCTTQNVYNYDFCVARLLPNGELDSSFSGTGVVKVGIGGSHDYPSSMAIDSGRILLAGICDPGSGSSYSFCAMRLNENGTLDSTFNGAGTLLAPAGESGAIKATALPIGGKIYLAGTCGTASAYFCVLRLNGDGSNDSTFGVGGRVMTGYQAAASYKLAMAANDASAVYVPGACDVAGQRQPCVIRIMLDGTIDTAFSNAARLPATASSFREFLTVAVTNGRAMAAGDCGSIFRPCVARFGVNGSLDASFGTSGILDIAFDAFGGDVLAMFAQAGSLLIGGYCSAPTSLDFCVAQVQNQTPPGPPRLTQAVGPSGGIHVTFSPPFSDGGEPISDYRFSCDNGAGTIVGSTSPLHLSGLVNGQNYQCALAAANANGVGESVVFTLSPSARPAKLLAVRSRKTHGAAGTFEITLDHTQSILGPITVEPRSSAVPHLLVFEFDLPIASVGIPTISGADDLPAGSAIAMVNGSSVEVQLAGIGDNRRVIVRIPAINSTQGLVSATLGFLVGDVNYSFAVDATDRSRVKARSGQSADLGSFKFDLNASGVISAADISAIKARSGVILQ